MEEKQLNVSLLIGNGFDIAILESLKLKYTTTYKEFYDYLTYFLVNKNNSIYMAINEKKALETDDNWMDYELLLSELVKQKIEALERISNFQNKKKQYEVFLEDWKEIQYMFADFLNHVITPDILKQVTQLSGKGTLKRLLGDLTANQYKNIAFPSKTTHHIEMNFHIFNFNYSSLVDNYFYWLFDYHPYNVSTNNFHFAPNPQSFPNLKSKYDQNTTFYMRSSMNIYHPHGRLSIPESILFGTTNDIPAYIKEKNNFNNELLQKLDKAYWARLDEKMQPILEKSDLFVIFGQSVGESDEWWWRQVIHRLAEGSELLIYDFEKNSLKEKFLSYCEGSKEIKKEIEDRIYVIDFDNSKKLKYTFTF
ncbi:AbiH family protein [Leuconostoc citreum]|uniref:AbiH family protein n=1 Tax=Leuconostoc citreum TaxID=33964 RepID=UPI0015D9D2EB|nr:AbiH family protein [Leuconostoc citreum]